MKILIVGSNGYLGTKLVEGFRHAGGFEVIAASRANGVDVLDPESLEKLPGDFDWIVDNVSGYRAGGFPRPGSERIAHDGHRNLARFAERRGARAILIGVIGSDQVDESIPHFLEKRLAESAYREAQVPLVSIRPGMFIDQADHRLEKGFAKGVYQHLGPTNVPFAVVETDAIVRAVIRTTLDTNLKQFEIRNVVLANVTAVEFAELMSRKFGQKIQVRALSLVLFSVLTTLPRLFSRGVRNLHGMIVFMASGRFVSNGDQNTG